MTKTKTIKAERSQGPLAPARRHPLLALREEMDDLLTRFSGLGADRWLAGWMGPALDISETNQAIEVEMDVPGIDPEKIDVQVRGNNLMVRGETEETKEERGRTIHRAERRTGSFSRSVTLPCDIVEDEVSAECHDGVLRIVLPKCEEAKAHKIPVKT